MEGGDSPRQADEEGLFVKVVEDGEFACKQTFHSALWIQRLTETDCDIRDNRGSNLKAKQLLDIGFGPCAQSQSLRPLG